MRVTSSFWVSAFVRRCFGEGLPAMVERRGAEEAGAIFIIVDLLNGSGDLYGPAPQTSFEARPSERLFQQLVALAPLAAIAERLERERRFDPDIWTVTVEDRAGRTLFDTVPADVTPR